MKLQHINRIKVTLILVLVLFSVCSFAQENKAKGGSFVEIGVKGGMSFTSISYVKPGNISETINSHAGFNVGVALKVKLPVKGLILQPEIAYVSKGSTFRGDVNLDVRMGYVEVPLGIQYGLDLIFFRPFLELSPYIGYAVSNSWESKSLLEDVTWNDINRLEYGLGVGAGVDVWKLQVKVKYNWNFGNLTDLIEQINKANFRGLELSLAFFF